MTNVSRIVSLGGSIYRIQRVSEGLGIFRFRHAVALGRSRLKPLRAFSEVWIFGGLESLEAGSA